ncbi:MAG TPA: hypothetical protein VF708_13485 [Pyrinomonadaceae bacterium]|jgi:hypothetical protein
MKTVTDTPFDTFDEAAYAGKEGGLLSLLLSARRLLVFVLLLILFMGGARNVFDPDFWWHLKTGQHIVDTGTIPHTDIFSTVFFGREWVTHEWLSEAIIYLIHRSLGVAGLVVTFALVVVAALWLAYRRCAQRVGHPGVACFALILGALAAGSTWGARPQMFSFLFASIYISVLANYYAGERRGRDIWWLVPLIILWVNMHAGFALGLVLIVLTIMAMALDHWLVESEPSASLWPRLRPLCFLLVACTLAVSLNPSGARIYLYPFETLTSQAMMKYIQEWFSPDFHKLMFLPLAVLLLATFAALALSKKRVRPGELLLLSATAYASLRSARNIPFFALVAMPLLAEHSWNWINSQPWGRWLTLPEKREEGASVALKIALNVLLLIVIPVSLCVLRVTSVVASQADSEAENFPVAAVEFVRKNQLPQPVFNEYAWGGYLIWKLYPDYRVYIDGRADVYGDRFLEEFLKTHDGISNWRAPLDRYGVRTVMIEPGAALASLLREDAGWNKVFEDQQAVIFVKR